MEMANKNNEALRKDVTDGFKRLAFGSSNDVVKMLLAISSENPNGLKGLNLFNLSEMRKTKEGFEVKLFDRQRAMEALLNIEKEMRSEQAATSLYAALRGEDVEK